MESEKYCALMYTKENREAWVLNNLQCLNLFIVQKHLDKINVNKTPGPDSLYPRVLKELSSVISKPFFSNF